MKLVEILNFVKKNTNSAFFYTPNIYQDGKSYFLKTPCKILKAKTGKETDEILHQVDKLSRDPNFIGFAAIPYETGYYFQTKKINNAYLNKVELQFLFYEKENVKIIDSDKLDFTGAENYFNLPSQLKEQKLEISKEDYASKVDAIKNYIANGDTYQINFTTKAKYKFEGDITALFIKGIFNQSAKYSAFINFPDKYIISFSPELFFETDYNIILCKPMKGTLKREVSAKKDKVLGKMLINDEKNLAENVMIVDLLRNDIGKISEINSVKVDKLFEVEKYETLFQLTSTVSGKLINNNLSNIIKNLFPCGSITGAPKIRSMEIISELENSYRGIYTGAIGIITNKIAVFNIPIRTITINKKTKDGELGLGSGIVWDSDAEKEYEEILLKGKFIKPGQRYFELLETMLFEDGKYFLLDYHLARLAKTADYFLFKYDEEKIKNELQKIASQFDIDKKYKIRFSLGKWGSIKITTEQLAENKTKTIVVLSADQRHKDKRFLYYKTTNRPWDKELKRAKQKGFKEVLFVNENNELLEGAVANLLVEKDGKLFTPPIDLGILNGCYRQYLLDKKKIKEKLLTVEDLKNADKIILCNSVRKEIIVGKVYDDDKKLIYPN